MSPSPSTPSLPDEPDDSQSARARKGITPSRMMVLFAVVVVGFVAYSMVRGPSAAMAGWIDDYSAGVRQATESRKPMLVLFTADWCPPCQQLKRDVWSDADVSKRLQERFTLVKVDLTSAGGPNGEVAATYDVRAIPTMIVFGTDGQQVARMSGGGDKEGIMGWAEAAGARAK